ncbi:MAG TPA: membrane dipeptidase, partial [Lacipirellulaceae bacterium]|nr:membrane dipeptidase [Lacipirellulaceae bacterium]
MNSHCNFVDRIFRPLLIAILMCDAGFSSADELSTKAEHTPIVLTDAARELHRRSLVIDGHNDLPWEIRTQGSSDFSKLDISQPQPKLHTDIPRLREGGVGAQFWSVWVPVDLGYKGQALATTLEQIELV